MDCAKARKGSVDIVVKCGSACPVPDSLTTGTEQPGSTADDEETTSTATPTSVITIRTITSNPITTTSNTVTYLQELIEVLSRKVENLEDKLQGEIEGVQGDITNVKGDITNVKSDIVDMQGDLVDVKDDISSVKGDLGGVQGDITNVQGDIVDMQDKLQEEIEGVQGNITNVQGDITNVQGDIVDMQNANSAFCAYQDEVGDGNNGLSGNIVVYNTTYSETNGASCSLDKSTGKFTAGKSGVYQVSVSAEVGYTYSGYRFDLYLRTSSGKYQDRYEAYIAHQEAYGTSKLFTSLSAIRFISLQQGETAWLEYWCSSGLTSTNCRINHLKFCVSLYK